MFKEKRKHSCCEHILIKVLLCWETSANNRAAFFKYLMKQWQHYLIYYERQRQSSWLCLWKGRTAAGWCFVFADSHYFSVCKSNSLCSESSPGCCLERSVFKMWADQINKNKLKQRHGATQGQPPLRTASALASDKLLSVLREIYTDWSRAIAHHPSHAVWDKPLFQTHTNTANWKGHYCGFSSCRRGKGNNPVKLVIWPVHVLLLNTFQQL